MACKTATPVVWVAVLAVVAAVVAENGRSCSAFDMSQAKESVVSMGKEAKDSAEAWSNWALHKVSGKLSLDPQDMKQGAEDMMHKASESASDAKEYASAKLHSVSHSSIPGMESTQNLYNEAKTNVGAAYNSLAGKTVHE